MSEIRQGQIYAGRLSGGQPAVVRVKHEAGGKAIVQVVRLDRGMMGREGFIHADRLAARFRLVSEGPEFTSEQVAGWMREVQERGSTMSEKHSYSRTIEAAAGGANGPDGQPLYPDDVADGFETSARMTNGAGDATRLTGVTVDGTLVAALVPLDLVEYALRHGWGR